MHRTSLNISLPFCEFISSQDARLKTKVMININTINSSRGKTVFTSPPLALQIVRHKMSESYEYFSQFSMYLLARSDAPPSVFSFLFSLPPFLFFFFLLVINYLVFKTLWSLLDKQLEDNKYEYYVSHPQSDFESYRVTLNIR